MQRAGVLIQTEQLRLLLSNMRSSLLPAIIVALLLGYTQTSYKEDAGGVAMACCGHRLESICDLGRAAHPGHADRPPARALAGAG
jgi:hypothetical protein